MATVEMKVRGLVKGTVSRDFVLVKVEGVDKRFAFIVNQLGTPDGMCVGTVINAKYKHAFTEAVEAKRETVIENNPKWEDVKTDDGTMKDTVAGDGKNNGIDYSWANDIEKPIYEICGARPPVGDLPK